jgi:hypothetical protein
MELDHADLNREQAEKLAKPERRPERLGSFAIEKPSTERKPERIGHVLVTTEPGPERVSAKRVETMSRTQLLELSEAIKLDGSSLRQIYETHLIGERGLRHLVAEYMRGGDLKQTLREEILERERDFERDPALRHISDEDSPLFQSKVTLEELLSKADLTADQQREETAFFRARAQFEAEELLQHKQRRRMIDITMAAIISILLLLIILLFVSRS